MAARPSQQRAQGHTLLGGQLVFFRSSFFDGLSSPVSSLSLSCWRVIIIPHKTPMPSSHFLYRLVGLLGANAKSRLWEGCIILFRLFYHGGPLPSCSCIQIMQHFDRSYRYWFRLFLGRLWLAFYEQKENADEIFRKKLERKDQSFRFQNRLAQDRLMKAVDIWQGEMCSSRSTLQYFICFGNFVEQPLAQSTRG